MKVRKLIPILVVVLILSAAIVGFFYYQSHKGQAVKGASTQSAEKVTDVESQKLIKEIGKLIKLPADETPTVATITDIEKLKDQPFFKDAKDGDKVLIYAQNKKIYLYDPKKKQITDVAPFNPAPVASDSATPTP